MDVLGRRLAEARARASTAGPAPTRPTRCAGSRRDGTGLEIGSAGALFGTYTCRRCWSERVADVPAAPLDRHEADMARFLTALPVFNEAAHVAGVLDEVLRFTARRARGRRRLDRRHGRTARRRRRATSASCGIADNRGYGAALATAFATTLAGGWDGLVTIDCDGQHQPRLIPEFIAAASRPGRRPTSSAAAATCSGFPATASRRRRGGGSTPRSRPRSTTGSASRLTDAFCGFKAYSRRALERLHVTETGYAMPLEVWVQAAAAGLRDRRSCRCRSSISIWRGVSGAHWTMRRPVWPTTAACSIARRRPWRAAAGGRDPRP